MAESNLTLAIKKWKKLLGNDTVILSQPELSTAATTTFRTNQKIMAILKAKTVKEVRDILKIANRYIIPIYPISSGKNWGYGSAVPIETNSVLLDLSSINKIREYNQELGYVIVEPGVTQKQLFDFLKEKKAPYTLSLTGSSANTSLIGNICERGLGTGLYGFRSHHLGDLEVVLPNGDIISTGYSRFKNAKAAEAFPDGFGPSFDSIFFQSNLGIITAATLHLVPTPKYIQFIDCYTKTDKQLFSLLEKIRIFNFQTNSRKIISVYNDIHILASHTQYPWEKTKGKTPLSPNLLKKLKKKYEMSYIWRGVIELYGFTKQEVEAQVAYFKKFSKESIQSEISPLYKFSQIDEEPRDIGKATYWRMKTPPPKVKNPDVDGCGKIRLSLALPFIVASIRETLSIVEKSFTKHGYEPFFEIHCISERAVLFVISIVFDRTVEGEDGKALTCHDKMFEELTKKGYYPYRFNVHSMNLLPKSQRDYDTFQKTIKNALDPKHILSPGRYERKD